MDARLTDFQLLVEEAESSYAIRQVAIREKQVTLRETKLSTWQATMEQQKSHATAEMEAARGVATEVTVRIRRETLEEMAKSWEDAEAERAALSQRLERFKERAQAWTSLKEKHLARIRKLEEELDAATATTPSGVRSSRKRSGAGSAGGGYSTSLWRRRWRTHVTSKSA